MAKAKLELLFVILVLKDEVKLLHFLAFEYILVFLCLNSFLIIPPRFSAVIKL